MDRPFFYIMLHTQGVTDSSSVVSTIKKDIRWDVLFYYVSLLHRKVLLPLRI